MTSIQETKRRVESDARSGGYFLNPDEAFIRDLLDGLTVNEERYGYPSCPCRVGAGNFAVDRDIICPCDYRDADVAEYGACYCALFLRKDIFEGKAKLAPVPERRPREKSERSMSAAVGGAKGAPDHPATAEEKEDLVAIGEGKMKLYYCKQCGYVCYREGPPLICPVCKAKRELFAEISLQVTAKG